MNEYKNKLRYSLSLAFPKRTVSQDNLGDIWMEVAADESEDSAYDNLNEAIDSLPLINLPPERTRIFIFKKDKTSAKKHVINPATYDLI